MKVLMIYIYDRLKLIRLKNVSKIDNIHCFVIFIFKHGGLLQAF